MTPVRKIIHVDMDAFYASVEQRDDPTLKGRPVVVGGSPKSRAVVCTASYEARKFGVKSAMACSQAYRLCPQAVFLPPRFQVYSEVSRQIRQIFLSVTDLVEPLSLDEAYLDVTENNMGEPSATRLADAIRRRIFEETQLTASAGVAPNKFLAKLATEVNKPDGLTVIPPHRVHEFLIDMPVRKIHGIGKATDARMSELGIVTIRDLLVWSERDLIQHFGKAGSWYYQLARGEDDRQVRPHRPRKSIGSEETFARDTVDMQFLEGELWRLCSEVAEHVQRKQFVARTVSIKLTYSDFEKISRSRTVEHPLTQAQQLWDIAKVLLREHTEAGQRLVRLLGVSVSNPALERAREDDPQLWLPFMGEHIGPDGMDDED